MSEEKSPQNMLEDIKLRIKLASLWTSFMFLYIYVDYFHLFMPDSIENLMAGKAYVFDITQLFMLLVMTFVVIPVLMIFLSITLPSKVNRWTNIILATLYIPYMLFNLAGEAWMHMYLAAAIEVTLLVLIIRYAWKWPRIEA